MPWRPGSARRVRVALAALLGLCIVLNVAIGQLTRNVVKLPVFLDSIGTILAGSLAGPLAGAAVGAVSNLLWGVLFGDPSIMPYAITAACIGAAAAGAAALGAFKTLPATILAGLITGVLAALVSAPLTAYVQQAASGPGQVALRGVLASTSDNVLKVITLGPGSVAGVVGLLANLMLQVPPLGPGLGIDDWLRVAIYVSVSFLIALITDRLERTNAALAVALAEQREQEAQTRAVVNGVVEGLVLVGPDDFRLLRVNHQFEALFGVSGAQVVGRRLDELQDLVERVFTEPDAFRQRVTTTAADTAARFTETLQQVWPQECVLELFSTPVLSDGRFLGRLYGFRDVTQERELDPHEDRVRLAGLARATDAASIGWWR